MEQKKEIMTVRQMVETVQIQFIEALSGNYANLSPKAEQRWKQEADFAVQALTQNEYLLNAARSNPGSLKTAIYNIALTGATLNPVLGKAYLVPRTLKGKLAVCLDFSYKGLAGIVMDSGAVKHIQPHLVYTFEDFSYSLINGEPKIHHSPNMDSIPQDFSEKTFWQYLKCGYTVSTLGDGSKIISPPMAKWQIEKAMKTSKTTGESTPWRTHPDEQSKKTLVKHTYKLLPQTPQASQAIQALNEHEGIDTSPTPFADRLRGSESKEDFTLSGDPVCICDDMVEQGVEEYDCPAHGRRSKKGEKK